MLPATAELSRGDYASPRGASLTAVSWALSTGSLFFTTASLFSRPRRFFYDRVAFFTTASMAISSRSSASKSRKGTILGPSEGAWSGS